MFSGIDKLLGALTSTKSVLLAAPVVLGIGLLMAVGGPAETSAPATGTSPSAPKVQVAQATTQPQAASPAKPSSTFTEEQKKAIGSIVRDYLLTNPEILIEVSQELEKRQSAKQAEEQFKLISSQKKEIFHSPMDYVAGNKDAKITIVEYFDYNCGWCKRALEEIAVLIKEEPNVRVVLKEFPIFGEHSEFAAKAAMASIPQGKYWDFHIALMKEKRVTTDNVMTIAERVGLDVAKLKEEMAKPVYEEAMRRTMTIAQSLGIQGTPGFIIDGEISPGYLPVAALKQKIAEVRERGCQLC
jgi:protein-disulfide isomerase